MSVNTGPLPSQTQTQTREQHQMITTPKRRRIAAGVALAAGAMGVRPRRIAFGLSAVAAVAAAVSAAGCGGGADRSVGREPRPARSEARLRRALDGFVGAGVPGAIVLVRDGDQIVRLASGYRNLAAKTPLRPTDRFRVGSVTKSFVATVVLQLVGEGRLALDDTVERWLPGLVPNGDHITVRELLNHTSGLFDYTADPRFIGRALRDRAAIWSPRRVLRLATSHAPGFAPGARWAYSNTGYIVLGLIVEAATGHQIGTELRRRIFEPLRLRATSFDSTPRIAGAYAHGYFALTGPRQDASAFSPSGAWAAGAIVSSADDLARFYRALLGGRLLRPALLSAMQTTVPVPADPHGGGSGLGLFETGSPCGRIWGHDGTFFGYQTLAWSSPDAQRQVVAMVNDAPLSDGAMKALRRLVDTAYCGRDDGHGR
jgi:D-alanyl-D-alanine carboxypeptidase